MSDRAPLDAYWTPDALALACTSLVVTELGPRLRPYPDATPLRVVEPSVGGGAWVRALRHYGASVHACDVDPAAPGLVLADTHHVGSYLDDQARRPADLVIGNPPYCDPVQSWVTTAVMDAPWVAYLLRSSVLGSRGRSGWWAAHPPEVVWALSPRPRWEGPGAQPSSDTHDPVLVLWGARPAVGTELRWWDWGGAR
jgi:hypothetical protein